MKRSILHLTRLLLIAAAALLSVSAFAQDRKHKSLTIIINDGDTVVNGKDFKKITPQEKADLLKEFPSIRDKHGVVIGGTGLWVDGNGPGEFRMHIFGDSTDVMLRNHRDLMRLFNDSTVFAKGFDTLMFRAIPDSLRKRFRVRDFGTMAPEAMAIPRRGFIDRDRGPAGSSVFGGSASANTQTFSYSNTDKNGISTRVNFRVSDAKSDTKNTLELTDISLVHNFASGKETLAFSLATKGATEVKLLDPDDKPLFSEKLLAFSGSFSRQFDMARNGVYTLQITQAGKTAVKKIVKQN